MLSFILEEVSGSDLEIMKAKLEKLGFEETISDSYYKDLTEDYYVVVNLSRGEFNYCNDEYDAQYTTSQPFLIHKFKDLGMFEILLEDLSPNNRKNLIYTLNRNLLFQLGFEESWRDNFEYTSFDGYEFTYNNEERFGEVRGNSEDDYRRYDNISVADFLKKIEWNALDN